MDEPAVVPADRDEAASTRRRRLGGLVALAAALAGVAVLLGTPPPVEGPDGQTERLPPPLASFTTTTTEGSYVPRLAGRWVPTWFPGEGRFAAVSRLPGGGWVLAQVSNRGGTSTTLWRSPDGAEWQILTELDGIVTGLAAAPGDVLVAVGAVVEGDLFREALATTPTVWVLDRGPARAVHPPGGPGVVAAVTATPEGLVAVGWKGRAQMWPELSPTSDPVNEPAAWWSTDGTRWEAAEIDTGGLVGGAMVSVAAGTELMVAGGTGSGSARLWESADGGRSWRSVDQADRVWPAGQVFRSVAAAGDDVVAVSGTLDPDTPRSTLWRRGSDGWEWAEPEGINERLVAKVAAAGDELVAFSGAAFDTSSRLWASPDATTWKEITLPDPCGRCPLADLYGSSLQIGTVGDDLVGGSVTGQPVLWSRHTARAQVPVSTPGWERMEPALTGAVPPFVVYYSEPLTVFQGRGVRILVDGEPMQPAWGAATPQQVDHVEPVAGGWYLSGWADGGPAVWWSGDGVTWRVVAEAREPVSPLVVVAGDAGAAVVGIGAVAVDSDLDVVDLTAVDEGLEYVMAAVPWNGGILAVAGGARFRQLVAVGTKPPALEEGLGVVGFARVGDRLVLGVEEEDGDARVLVYDEAGTRLADVGVPFSPWSLTEVGGLVVAEGVTDRALWISSDGEGWLPIPIDPGHGFPGVTVGQALVRTDGDLVLQGADRGEPGLWRWTGPLP